MKSILVSVVLFSSAAFAQTSDSYTERWFRAKLGRSAPVVEKSAKIKPAKSCGDCCKR